MEYALLGKGIRRERLRKGLTQRQLAQVTSLSVSAISQIENGINSPSIVTLRRVAGALDVPLFRFLTDTRPSQRVVRRNQRRTMTFPDSNLIYQALSPDSQGTLEMLHFTLEPKGMSGPEAVAHPSDECLLVLSGTLEIEVEGEPHTLVEGDSIYIHAGLRHLMRNLTESSVHAVLAIAPPIF